MDLFAVTITILLVMDPLGNTPVFAALLKDMNPQKRAWIILRETLFALAILIAFLFGGQYIMKGLQISEPALSIGGGIILFLIAIKLIFSSSNSEVEETKREPFLVPLAIPLIAGPATMAMLMVLADQHSVHIWGLLSALIIAWCISTLILLSSTLLSKLLGDRGLTALEKLMGMILTTLSVQMLLTGIQTYFKLMIV